VSDPRRHLPARIRAELQGLDWEVTNGGRHAHLRVGGKLLAVLPHGRISDNSAWLETRSLIRRYRRGLGEPTVEGGNDEA
jgi:hypothetical protein